MNESRKTLSEILTTIAAALDVPDHVYEDAVLKYEDVGTWLSADESSLQAYSPDVYPQGSFRLGTVVQPILDDNEYDIDLVCELDVPKETVTQRDLKQMVGDRLTERDDLRRILTPSRRCWVLQYPSTEEIPQFHMDVLPAIPNVERPPSGILITDSELSRWQKSNPRAFSEWFYERMRAVFEKKRAALAESAEVSVEDIPEWQVKTPLQISVQILKRHRDLYFSGNPDDRPVSIIITTLAGRSYRGQTDVYDALTTIVQDMPRFIEKRGDSWWVANPVDPDENFADKWNDHPERREAFFAWLSSAQADLSRLGRATTVREAVESVRSSLGERTMAKSAADLGVRLTPDTYVVERLAGVPDLADTRHSRAPTWPIERRHKARISGSVHLKRGAKKLWPLTDRDVPKNVWLRFTVTTNTPEPFETKWQVVNTGKEAAEAGQLRGGFYDSDKIGGRIRWESTKYRGTHWIEAFITKDGVCVAKSGRRLVRVR